MCQTCIRPTAFLQKYNIDKHEKNNAFKLMAVYLYFVVLRKSCHFTAFNFFILCNHCLLSKTKDVRQDVGRQQRSFSFSAPKILDKVCSVYVL